MPTASFTGHAVPLTADGIAQFTSLTQSDAASMWAVLATETSGCGFLPDRRPKILFERHVFHALTGGAYDRSHPAISQPSAGGYGEGGANQYVRLAVALALNSAAALKSASWGIGQVMGENFRQCGFPTVDAMVAAMVESEDHQLAAMAAFLKAGRLSLPLSRRDWAGFARGYNGPDYARNNYDGLLRQFDAHFSWLGLPDLRVRAVQVLLSYRALDAKGIDGSMGPDTRAAIRVFQTNNELSPTGAIDDALVAALSS
jgi:hypothetical protein